MTKHRIAAPRTPAPGDTHSPASEPPGLTTFSAALTQWKTTPPEPDGRPADEGPAPAEAGPRLLHDQALPEPPPGLPALPALQNLAHTAADRARRILDGIPLPTTPLADAVHIADTTSLTDPTPAYRLDIDLGHWRELLTHHRTHGCTTGDAAPDQDPSRTRSCRQ
ncbi:hypothetical protein [Streptomyces sp. NPDC058861]|uniref:hypothetical protein n=1 Tax=Streptomyces sp. NPDC058861 TaxID=3346653 RepID=UPI00367AA063